MPNWVQQRIRFESIQDLEKVMKAIKPSVIKKGEEDVFSFNWIKPQPKKKEKCPEEYITEKGEKSDYIDDWFDWYHWNNDNWGTKWDACDPFIDDKGCEIWFQTAWSPAVPIWEELHEKFPDIHFVAEFAEEQGGYFCGEFDSDTGYFDFEEYSDEAYEMYNLLWGDTFEKLEDDEWHTEDEEGVFFDSNNQMHFFDLNMLDSAAAKGLYKTCGDSFIEFLLEYNDSQEFLRSLLGDDIIG